MRIALLKTSAFAISAIPIGSDIMISNMWVYKGIVKAMHQDDRGRSYVELVGNAADMPGWRAFQHGTQHGTQTPQVGRYGRPIRRIHRPQ